MHTHQGKHSDSRQRYIRCLGASVSTALIWHHVLPADGALESSISPAVELKRKRARDLNERLQIIKEEFVNKDVDRFEVSCCVSRALQQVQH